MLAGRQTDRRKETTKLTRRFSIFTSTRLKMRSGLKCGIIEGLKTLFSFSPDSVQSDKLRHIYYSLCGHPDLSCGALKSVKEVMWFYTINAKNYTTPFSVQTPLTVTSQRSQWSLNYDT
jgi:hypothetical protein